MRHFGAQYEPFVLRNGGQRLSHFDEGPFAHGDILNKTADRGRNPRSPGGSFACNRIVGGFGIFVSEPALFVIRL